MRKNHDKRRRDAEERYDRVYVEWPHLWEVKQVVARPLKTIYINSCANSWARDRTFADVDQLESFCARWNINLP